MPDARVTAAIHHLAPRFVSNGVPLTDFQEVTAQIEHRPDWCAAWSKRAGVHQPLGDAAFAQGCNLSAGEHWPRAALCYHFAKFVFVEDVAQMKAAHVKAVDCRNEALPYLQPAGKLDRIVPWTDGERLAKSAKGPVEFLLLDDGNHVANNRGYRWRSQSADWMARQLSGKVI